METETSKTAARSSKWSIDYDTAYQAHLGTSFSPEKRAQSAINGFDQDIEQGRSEIMKAAKIEEAKLTADSLADKWCDKLKASYIALLNAKAHCMSTMIAGPANFPVARNQKRLNSVDTKTEEFLFIANEKKEKYIRIIEKIKPAGWSELIETQCRLKNAKEVQERMKSANKIVKKAARLEPAAAKQMLVDNKLPAELLTEDFSGRIGFAGFELTNNNSLIKRLQAKVKKLERQEVAKELPKKELKTEACKIVENAQIDRLQLVFDGKPSEEVRTWLKSNGFRWSPKEIAWQRKLTNNARYAALDFLELIKNNELTVEGE